MNKHFDITSIEQLKQAISFLLEEEIKGVLYLSGHLGTGKTTFTRYFLEKLGFTGIVSSPTYSIVNEYEIGKLRVLHADLYRLSDSEELLYLDVREWKDQADFIFIEWAEKGDNLLPPADFICQFTLQNTCRFLSISKKIH